MAAIGALETISRPRIHLAIAPSSSTRSSLSIRGGQVALLSLRLPQFTGLRVSQRIRPTRPATAGQANPRADRRSNVVCEFRQVASDGNASRKHWKYFKRTRGRRGDAGRRAIAVVTGGSTDDVDGDSDVTNDANPFDEQLRELLRSGGILNVIVRQNRNNVEEMTAGVNVGADRVSIAADGRAINSVQEVLENVTQCSKPAVVEFWASWCGPCRIMRPVVARLASKYNGKLKFFKMDMDKSRDIAAEYGVSKIPALLLIKNGKKKDAVIGCASEKELASRIDKFLGM